MPLQDLNNAAFVDAFFVPATPGDSSAIDFPWHSMADDGADGRHLSDRATNFAASAFDHDHNSNLGPFSSCCASNDDDAWTHDNCDADLSSFFEGVDLSGSDDLQALDRVTSFTASSWENCQIFHTGPFSNSCASNGDDAWTHNNPDDDLTLFFEDVNLFGGDDQHACLEIVNYTASDADGDKSDGLMSFFEPLSAPLSDISLDEFLELCDDFFPDTPDPHDLRTTDVFPNAASERVVIDLTGELMSKGHASTDEPNNHLDDMTSYCQAEHGNGFAGKPGYLIPTASPAVIDLTGDSEYGSGDEAFSEDESCSEDDDDDDDVDVQMKTCTHQDGDYTFSVVGGHAYPFNREGHVNLVDVSRTSAVPAIIDLTGDSEYGSGEEAFSEDEDGDLQMKGLTHQDGDGASIAVGGNT